MSYITDTDLDALFTTDNMDFEPPLEAKPPSYPLTTFHPFTLLPPELRNNIYTTYLTAFHATNPLRINTSGSILLAPLTNTCRTTRHETKGYTREYLHQVLTAAAHCPLRIEAQIQAYDPTPLRATLRGLAAEFGVPEARLQGCTTVTFVGGFHFANIMAWICGPPLQCTFFEEKPLDAADLPAFAKKQGVGMFTGGPLSLVYVVDQVLFLEQHAPARLRCLVTEFLEMAELLGYRGLWDNGMRGGEVVFEFVARWHFEMRRDFARGSKKRMSVGELRQCRAKHADMANLVYAFWMKCTSV